MKTEDLQKLGLTEEQIKEVHKLNGKDIEGLKAEKTVLEAEKESLTTQLKNANAKIEEFKDIDVNAIKQEVEKYKNDYNNLKNSSEAEINNLKLNHSIENSLLKSKVKNTKAVKALLDLETLKNSKNFEIDLENQIKSIKETDSYLFEGTDTGAISGNNQIEEPKTENMTYSQMMEYMEKNPGAKF